MNVRMPWDLRAAACSDSEPAAERGAIPIVPATAVPRQGRVSLDLLRFGGPIGQACAPRPVRERL